MSRQAPHIATLKAEFLQTFGMRLNCRIAGGSLRNCLQLSVPAFRDCEEIDRTQLIELGAWLEARGYFECYDLKREGKLSSPAGWTCWNGGLSVLVRYWPG